MYDRIEKKLPVVIVIVSAALVLIGYSMQTTGSPTRVLFRTSAGPVVFDHKAHFQDYGYKCDSCHHELHTKKKIWDCRACHSKGIEEYEGICDDSPIHKQCIGQQCIDCHKEAGLETDDCKECHR